MGSFTEGIQPITVSRGRDLALPMAWKNPDGTAVNIAGFTISGALKWRGKTKALTVADRVNAAGTWEFQLALAELATLSARTTGAAHGDDRRHGERNARLR